MDYYRSDGMYGSRLSSSGSGDSRSTSDADAYSSSSSSSTTSIRLWVLTKLSDVFWYLVLFISTLIMPVVKAMALVLVIILISMSASYFMYLSLSPKSLLREKVYFDFSRSSPSARVSLVAREKQWYYLKNDAAVNDNNNAVKNNNDIADNSGMGNGAFNSHRFLKSDSKYTIDAAFVLAKCPRNFDIGKFMVHTTVVDTSGDAIAKSSRPVAVPYQSTTSVLLDSLLMFPFRFVGLSTSAEMVTVDVNIMNEFTEPTVTIPATEYLEMVLSTNDVDVIEVYLSIMPVLRGLTYYVYYYPYMFLSLCSIVLSLVQAFVVAMLLLVSWVLRYVSALFSKDGAVADGDMDVDIDRSDSDDNDDDNEDNDNVFDEDNDDNVDEDDGGDANDLTTTDGQLTLLSLSALNHIGSSSSNGNSSNGSHSIDNAGPRRSRSNNVTSNKYPLGIANSAIRGG